MTKHWALPLKLLYSIGVSCIFVIPALIGYALKLQITRQSFWTLGIYGVIVFTFIFLQLLFATLNRILVHHYRRKLPPAISRERPNMMYEAEKKIDPDSSDSSSDGSTLGALPKHGRPATVLGLAVVGYREEPQLFKKCLESIQQLQYPDPFKIIVVIDGDEPADREMADIFQSVFPQSPVLVLPELLSVSFGKMGSKQIDHDGLLRESFTLPTDVLPVCYLQPHRGKRHAMYTAFRILLAAGCEAVMSTDSDTKFNPQAMLEMESALYWFPNIGAVAGDVRIWNSGGSLLSFMSSLRYWMAFNIERAAQSFNRCVTCVSGPMGIYRANVLREILDDWIVQTFLGLECTYGDDRHLTNRALLHGYRVVYTHLAFCETETPTNFLRWFKQQTRWSKSFYRELLWNARSIHKHSPWMAAELFYQGIYPFVLLFSIFQILFNKSPFVLCVWVISLGAIACIKTIYSIIVARSFRFLAFPFYSIYYMIGLVPAKLWAIVSLWDVGWGTSARSASEMKRENAFLIKIKEALPVIVWLLLLLGAVVFNIVMFMRNPDKVNGLDFFGIGSGTIADPSSIVFYPNPNYNPRY